MGKFIQAFKMSMKSIMGNKGRSALTMLGIIIGVLSVIILTGVGGGATDSITEQIEDMGVNTVSVTLMRSRGSTRTVELEDMQQFQGENADRISMMTPVLSSTVTAKVGNKNTEGTTSLTGVDSDYLDIQKLNLISGRYFSDFEISNRSKVCVIGTYLVQELFGGVNPVGEEMKINGEVFEIIGVYEEQSESEEGGSDDTVTIPYTTAMRFLKTQNISTYYFYVDNEDDVSPIADELDAFIATELGTDEGYSVIDPTELLETMDEIMGTMTTMLAGIAGISLIVGGIGIMNIMTVSVSERTREIGIRKAIGARTTDILLQFLIESTVLSGMGGIIGIILGFAIGEILNQTEIIVYSTQMNMVAISFLFSLAVGVFFGLAPAKKAAKLNPIEALHSE